LLLVLSRYLIRRAAAAGRNHNIVVPLVLLYALTVLPIAPFAVAAYRGRNVLLEAFITFAFPILALPILVGAPHRLQLAVLFIVCFSLSTLLLFAVLAASYAMMLSRRFSHMPLAWLLDRAERRGDILGALAAALLFASTGVALAAAIMGH
jgi:hypothetical protein